MSLVHRVRPWLAAIALGCGWLSFSTAVLAQDEKQAEDASKVERLEVAHIELKGALREGSELPGLFGEVEETFAATLKRLDKAAGDDDVHAVVLHVNGPTLGWGKLNELRQAIARVRKGGKRVFAFLESGMTQDYLLACACDQIVLPEPGLLMMPGLRAEVTFYKNLFDKLDVRAETLRVGEFKSAGEPYSRAEMSPEFRKEMEEVLDDYYRIVIETIAEDRKLSIDAVKEIVDIGVLTAAEAKARGLVDILAYEDRIPEVVKGDRQNVEIKLTLRYGKKKIDTDFSGMAGLIKMMNLMSGVDTQPRRTSGAKIAIVYAQGMIMEGASSSDFLGGETMGSATMIKAIRQARDDKSVKAVVLRIDSPGGSALASDLMWHELETLEKPFVVSMGNTAASGGYYIAMGADRIFAEPGTLTGSIGVVSVRFALDGLYKKVGVNTEVIQRGKNSGLLSATSPLSDSERAALQSLLDDIYRQFTTKAAAGRKMDVAALEKLARGRVYTGSQALKLGLVDELGTLSDAVAYARKIAGLDEQERVDQLILPKSTSPLEQLFGPLDTETRTRAVMQGAVKSALPDSVTTVWRQWLALERLARQPACTLLPFQLEVR